VNRPFSRCREDAPRPRPKKKSKAGKKTGSAHPPLTRPTYKCVKNLRLCRFDAFENPQLKLGASGPGFGSHYGVGLQAPNHIKFGSQRVLHRFVKRIANSRTPQRFLNRCRFDFYSIAPACREQGGTLIFLAWPGPGAPARHGCRSRIRWPGQPSRAADGRPRPPCGPGPRPGRSENGSPDRVRPAGGRG
jgi:hypothetical protein